MKWLIKIAAFVYMAGGIVAAYLSFNMEYAILQDIIADFDWTFALIGAALFETIKICTIILYRSSSSLSVNLVPDSVKAATWMLRFGLFTFAFFCALTFFSKSLTNPYSENLRAEETQMVTTDYDNRINALRSDAEVAKLQSDLDNERDNIRGGTFIGIRYKDFDARLVAAKKNRDEKVDKLTEEKASKLDQIRSKNYQDDARSKNKTINDLVTTIRNVVGINLNYNLIILLLTALISGLIELSIWVAFELIVIGGISGSNALQAEADELDEEIKAASKLADKHSLRNEVMARLSAVKSFGENIKSWFQNKPLE